MGEVLANKDLSEIEARDKAIRWSPDFGPCWTDADVVPALRDRHALLAEVRARGERIVELANALREIIELPDVRQRRRCIEAAGVTPLR